MGVKGYYTRYLDFWDPYLELVAQHITKPAIFNIRHFPETLSVQECVKKGSIFDIFDQNNFKSIFFRKFFIIPRLRSYFLLISKRKVFDLCPLTCPMWLINNLTDQPNNFLCTKHSRGAIFPWYRDC